MRRMAEKARVISESRRVASRGGADRKSRDGPIVAIVFWWKYRPEKILRVNCAVNRIERV